jgi:hypothetical protein
MDRFSYISKRKRLLSLGSTIEKKETLGMAVNKKNKKKKNKIMEKEKERENTGK